MCLLAPRLKMWGFLFCGVRNPFCPFGGLGAGRRIRPWEINVVIVVSKSGRSVLTQKLHIVIQNNRIKYS